MKQIDEELRQQMLDKLAKLILKAADENALPKDRKYLSEAVDSFVKIANLRYF